MTVEVKGEIKTGLINETVTVLNTLNSYVNSHDLMLFLKKYIRA